MPKLTPVTRAKEFVKDCGSANVVLGIAGAILTAISIFRGGRTYESNQLMKPVDNQTKEG